MLEKNLPFIPKVPNLEELAEQLIDKVGVSVTRRFQIFLVEYLAEAYGVRQSQLKPDLECFVNAQANTYAYRGRSELNNICGSVLWKKTWRKAGATFPYWRHNLAWAKAEMATLRDAANPF
ncbi:MAG: hypothetical protein F6K21_02935 [Symploca sp. SIO2D2]|nr:hypothetical protein [Symploca sp. SIO2D2]